MDLKRDYHLERKYFDKMGFEIFNDRPGDITLNACPICNEGGSYGKKHRFHWKFDIDNRTQSYTNCFNCGFGMDFEFFVLKFLGEEEFKNLMKEYQQYDNNEETIFNEIESELIQNPRTISVGGLEPIIKNQKVYQYLKDRKLDKFHEYFLSDQYDNVVIPLYNKNKKIYGYQTRKIDNKNFWFELEEINKKFRAWNFYNIDWEAPVYIFESVEDALSSGLENVMAVMGKYISPFIISKLKEPIICFDNDEDGKKAMYKQVLKYNCKAIVYPKNFDCKDANEMLKDKNYSFEYIKDFILKNIKSGFRLKILAESLIR